MPNLNRNDDLVVYHNIMNTFSFAGFTSADFSLFAAICCHVKNKGTEPVTFTFEELRDIAGLDKHYSVEELGNIYLALSNKMLGLRQWFGFDENYKGFTLFSEVHGDKETQTVTVVVAEQAEWVFNRLERNFTTYHLASYTPIDSKYAKSLYRLLRTFRSTGKCYIPADKIRGYLSIPDSYNTGMIMQNAIEPSLNELGKYFENLKVEVVSSSKRGGKVEMYRFTFDKAVEKKSRRYENASSSSVSSVIASSTKPTTRVKNDNNTSASNAETKDTARIALVNSKGAAYPAVPGYIVALNEAAANTYPRSGKNGVLTGSHYPANSKNKFCDFEQHDYDFGALEKLLLKR